jgi:integrase
MPGVLAERLRDMSARRDKRFGHWFYRKQIRTRDGRTARIFGVPTTIGLPDTKAGAEEAERRHLDRVLNTGEVTQVPTPPTTKEVPTVREFSTIFLETSKLRNKPSTIDGKRKNLNVHLLPLIGDLRLDEVTYTVVEDVTLALASKQVLNPRKKPADGIMPKLSPKSVNNALMVLHRMLVVARKRRLIDFVPDFEWLRAPLGEFDFLSFEEADRLINAAEGQLRAMLIIALRTGMRHGELLALRWQDVDLVAGRIVVRQNVVRGVIGTPKSGKPREIPLGDDARNALKAHRHLRGQYVFCTMDGKMLTDSELKNPLAHVVKRAGLARSVGWHCLRHSFASHLAMRGASLKVIQDLLGHGTITMTMRYAHLSPEIGRDAVRLLDNGASARGSVVAASTENAANCL